MPKTILLLGLLIAVLSAFGCSSGGDVDVLTPGEASHEQAAEKTHQMWGLWQFTADPAAETLDVVPMRIAEMHLNALHFLEPPPFVYLSLENLEFNSNLIDADIGLRHPFLGLTEFTGFDVCGTLITNGSITGFSDPDLRMAGEGDTRLLNPDGYSRWWNPTEFPVNDGSMFSYKDGFLGAPDSQAHYNSTLNAYKYFCDDLAADDPMSDVTQEKRGMFSAGKKNIRHYTIEMGTEGLIFNYAVDACWMYPQGDFPWTAPDDFAPEANRPEAWRISVTEVENTLWNDGTESGGESSLAIDVYDWFNAHLNTVRVESPGNFGMVESETPIGGGEGYSTYQIDIIDATPGEGSIDLLICIESEDVGPGGLGAFFRYELTVSPESNLDPVCDFVADDETPLPAENFSPVVVTFDATGSYDPDEDILTFEWDFDGDEIYGEDPDDNYFGDPDNPTHHYTSSLDGDVSLRLTDGNGGEAICSLEVVVTAHQSKNIQLRSQAVDLGVDPSNGDLWIVYDDRQVWLYALNNWYDDETYKYQSCWNNADVKFMDIASGGYAMYMTIGHPGYGCELNFKNSTGGTTFGVGLGTAGSSFFQDGTNFGTSGTYANNLAMYFGVDNVGMGYYNYYMKELANPYTAPPTYNVSGNMPYSPVTGYNRVFHEYVVGLDTGLEGTDFWFLEAPDYYCAAFKKVPYSSWHVLSYNDSYFGAGSEQTDDTGWTADVCDLSRDDTGRFHVLDNVSDEPVIKVFTGSSTGGTSHGHYGDSDTIGSTPLKLDGGDFDGKMFVLHGSATDGYYLSIFMPIEMPE